MIVTILFFHPLSTATSASIQAWSSVISTFFSILTLVILFFYAKDTRKIANASVRQAEDAETPFLGLVNNDPGISGQGGQLAIRNQGKGVAINISYTGYRAGCTCKKFAKPLGPGEMRALGSFSRSDLKQRQFVVEYQSLSARAFATEVTYTNDPDEDEKYTVKFERKN